MCNNHDDHELRRKHTASHIMTFAVKMMYPDILLGVGPWTDTGFYQDFDFGEKTISDKEFKKIQKKMRWIVNKGFKIERKEFTEAESREIWGHDKYKLELIDGIVERGEQISAYDFVNEEGRVVYRDICAGPHLESTGDLGIFKLTKMAAAYWRGDSDRETLTRIYGVAFANEEKLAEYEKFLEEAAKRDHRKLGKELDLFTFSEKIGAGLPLFTPKGTFIRNKIEDTIMNIQSKYGFERVNIPHITKKDLYETSGHWAKFKDDLFHVHGKGDTEFVMKPMNCPHHTQIYASQMRSYRDLPIRYAETTTCYRDEQPGELLGLSRVRSLTQDDGHIFCTPDQVLEESRNLVKVIREFYTKLGMFNDGDFKVSLSVRDSAKLDKYLGSAENWDKAENFLEEIAKSENLPYERIEGEAAFYGPKLDFQFKDSIGREWQLATIQIDFVQPERFELEYVDNEGKRQTPVMIHRAIAGSLERFMAVIIEHFAGAFPAWLAPVQAHILPVTDDHLARAEEILAKIRGISGRAIIAEASDTLGKRLRNSQTGKIPFSVIIGDGEVESGKITVRKYGEKKDEEMSVKEFLGLLEG